MSSEGGTRGLVDKLETLAEAVKKIQVDIEEESKRKIEAEEKLKKINDELANISIGDQVTLKQKIRAEINELVTNRVTDKVEIEHQAKLCEALTVEREFMIDELERLLQQYRTEVKGTIKKDLKELKLKMSEMKEQIENYKVTNVELQNEIKEEGFKSYDLSREAEELRTALGKYYKVRDTLNSSVTTPAIGAKRPTEQPTPPQKSTTSKVESKKKQPKMGTMKQQTMEEGDEDFWFKGQNA